MTHHIALTVVAVTNGAHRTQQSVTPEVLGEGPRRELRPVIGVGDSTTIHSSLFDGHVESVYHELRVLDGGYALVSLHIGGFEEPSNSCAVH